MYTQAANWIFDFIARAFRGIIVNTYNNAKKGLEDNFGLNHHEYVYEEPKQKEHLMFPTIHKIKRWMEAKAFKFSFKSLNFLLKVVLKQVRSHLDLKYEATMEEFEKDYPTWTHWMQYYNINTHMHALFDGIVDSTLNAAVSIFNHLKQSIATGKQIPYNEQLNLKFGNFNKAEADDLEELSKNKKRNVFEKMIDGCKGLFCGLGGRHKSDVIDTQDPHSLLNSVCGHDHGFEVNREKEDDAALEKREHHQKVLHELAANKLKDEELERIKLLKQMADKSEGNGHSMDEVLENLDESRALRAKLKEEQMRSRERRKEESASKIKEELRAARLAMKRVMKDSAHAEDFSDIYVNLEELAVREELRKEENLIKYWRKQHQKR